MFPDPDPGKSSPHCQILAGTCGSETVPVRFSSARIQAAISPACRAAAPFNTSITSFTVRLRGTTPSASNLSGMEMVRAAFFSKWTMGAQPMVRVVQAGLVMFHNSWNSKRSRGGIFLFDLAAGLLDQPSSSWKEEGELPVPALALPKGGGDDQGDLPPLPCLTSSIYKEKYDPKTDFYLGSKC